MFVRPLAGLRAADVAIAGGKGANLGALVAGGFPVPDGFVLTTAAYDAAARVAGVDPRDPPAARERLLAAPIPPDVAAEAVAAYRALGGGPVAVRSSATAEDLPGASFAGQQDTILGVDGEDALRDAIRRCWASLWNDRAVAYRAANAIDPGTVSLAVVVQRMVDAAAAGVLFTADPVAGTRRRAVIEAVRGLGERLVSGAVDPDRYVADPRDGAIRERSGDALRDDEVAALARLGARVEDHFGAPQDIEFALDGERRIWLVQSRAITTLYPLPPGLPDPDADLRVYLSANVAQGVFGPLTPMGLQTFRLIGSAFATIWSRPPSDPVAGTAVTVEAGMRLFLDLTPLVRHPVGRRFVVAAMGQMESRSRGAFVALATDPRLRVRPARRSSLLAFAHDVWRTGAPRMALRALARPDRTRTAVLRDLDAAIAAFRPPEGSAERLDAYQRLILEFPRRFFPRLVGLVLPAFAAIALTARVFGDRARPDELQTVLRGLPHNPTTEMDLALWAIARRARDDAPSREVLAARTPGELGDAYRAGRLPPLLQGELATFLAAYGHRAIAEIDLGVPRWSEEPEHLLGAIANYQRLGDAAVPPDAQFARGAREAEAMIGTLLGRLHGPRRAVARFLLGRIRALGGLREQPKFQIMRIFALGRALLRPVGAELARAGRIAAPDDVFFLTLPEARRALAGEDLRPAVAERRATFARERGRRHVPRVLLSDGTDVEAALGTVGEGGLRGTPASPGTATAPARVILAPEGARLEPGEILVAPSTDPGWTPLFLTAGGLVMEMGGMMSHGAVVAREYGIPAVVGVTGATDRIATGQRVTVDGAAGSVSVEP